MNRVLDAFRRMDGRALRPRQFAWNRYTCMQTNLGKPDEPFLFCLRPFRLAISVSYECVHLTCVSSKLAFREQHEIPFVLHTPLTTDTHTTTSTLATAAA